VRSTAEGPRALQGCFVSRGPEKLAFTGRGEQNNGNWANASPDVSRCFPLFPDVFHLDGHILGTQLCGLLLANEES
jgi:hypothetical protein